MEIQSNSVVSKNSEIISSKMDDEVVMMSIEKGNYYGLNEVAARIWEIVSVPVRVDVICDTLKAEFEVDQALCFDEVVIFLGKLLDEKLIFIHNPS